MHPFLGITRSRCKAGWRSFIEPAQIILAQLDFEGPQILFEPLSALSSRNGHDIRALGQEPGQRQLGRRTLLAAGNILQFLHKLYVMLEVTRLEPRHVVSRIARGQVPGPSKSPRQEAAPERGIGDHRNAQFAARR